MDTERKGISEGQAELETVSCTLCGTEEATELYPSTDINDGTLARDYYSSSRRRVTHGRIVRCRSCGLVRTNPRDAVRTLSEVYDELRDPLYELEKSNRTITARRHFAFVERYAPGTGRLLDVGCSTGIFMAIARERAWEVEGIEASSWAVARARESFDLNAIQQAMVENAVVQPGSFDVVTLWDVLEHVADPTAVLNRIRGWLKPGGHLFLNVPNVESIMAKCLGERWPLLLREHLWYWSPKTSTRLLEKTGFMLLGIRPNHVTFSLSNVFTRLSQRGGRAERHLQLLAARRFTQNLRVRFPIGEINVAAKRD